MENNTKVVDISPISRGKRALVFLGDFFLCFILNFVLMSLAVQPLMSLAFQLSNREEKAIKAEKKRDDILYEYQLLFYESDTSKYDYQKNLIYTFDRFLSYYVFNESEPSEVKDSNYGHKETNDIFKSYYIGIASDSVTYNNLFNNSKYFIKNETGKSLKEEHISQLISYFNKGDELSETGKQIYDEISYEFLNEYASLINTIKKVDLIKGEESFVAQQKIMDNFASFSDWLYVISTLVAFALSWAIIFVFLPLIFQSGQTPTMKIMKINRIGLNNLFTLNKVEYFLSAIYQLPLCLVGTFFIPLTYVPFYYLFNLPLLISLSVVSLLLVLASSIVMLINKYHQSGSDLLSRSIMISEEDLDKIYKAKGYQL